MSTDPYEDVNRRIQSFNDGADRFVLKPVAKGYQYVTPSLVQSGVDNFFSNLNDPLVSINQLLQNKPKAAAADIGRFLINSTIGIAGLFDVAGNMGLDKHNEDFGQTFAVWGINQGPYLVLPFLGPSSARSAVGGVVDVYGFLPRYLDNVAARNLLTALSIIRVRANLLNTEKLVSGDRYLFVRDAYLQNRDYLVQDGVVDDPFFDDE